MLIGYDCEVFRYDWMIVFVEPETRNITRIHNNPSKLKQYYAAHKDDIFIGYNSHRYDMHIVRGIILGYEPQYINQQIIQFGKSAYEIDPNLYNVQLYNYDVMQADDGSLKKIEGMMGHDIRESSISFAIHRPLRPEEIEDTFRYCQNDVEETLNIFCERIADFEAHLSLINMFDLPLKYIDKTKTQLSAEIMQAVEKFPVTEGCEDEFDLWWPECVRIEKYTQVLEHFSSWRSRDYSSMLKTEMAGMEVTFGWGGVHGAIDGYHKRGYFLNMDVTSLYPSIMLNWPDDCFSRCVKMEGIRRFERAYNMRLELKKAGKKKEQYPYKIFLNATYGGMKKLYSKTYDPRAANNVCVTGMLLVGVDLIERLEGFCEIVQINTDGVLVRLESPDDFERMDDIAFEWECRTGLKLDFDDYGYGEIWQKDVNNYLIVSEDGHYKAKGKWLKEQSIIDNDLPIVRKAMIENFLHNVPVEKTINSCDNLAEFQAVRSISKKYSHIYAGCSRQKKGWMTGSQLDERCVRVFASKRPGDGAFCKKHSGTKQFNKLDDTPENAFAVNTAVNGLPVPEYLDRDWYIQKAKERMRGYELDMQGVL